MSNPLIGAARRYPCQQCPIRELQVFRPFTSDELSFVNRFKTGEISFEAKQTVLREGTSGPYLYTVLRGWAFRYKMLVDGRRQILGYALPGEFLGLQAALFDEMSHSVEALTDMLLCVFPRDRLCDLYQRQPGLAADLTWLAVRDGQSLDQHLATVGRRTAIERLAFLVVHLYMRARDLGLVKGRGFSPPITQQHVADTLGMSIVHTNKTLRRLYERHVIRWKGRQVEILDLAELKAIAMWDDSGTNAVRPLI